MNEYEHITKMENILNHQTAGLHELEEALCFIENHFDDFHALLEYYYSEQRSQDLQNDKDGKLPADLRRGVLSEDAIFDFLGDYRDTAFRMMELALKMLRAG